MEPDKTQHKTNQKVPQIQEIIINYFIEKTAKRNKVSTCKYKWWSFIFIFLYEQYQRACNIFYLINFICVWLPGAAVVTPATTALPIVFVLIVAAVREILEDVARAKSDRSANNQSFKVIRNGMLIETTASKICQGDLLIIQNMNEVPCDCLLIQSSNASKIGFVNTASLDGESNLKPRTQLLDFIINNLEDPQQYLQIFKDFRAVIKAQPPTSDMDEFNGEIVFSQQYQTILEQQKSQINSNQIVKYNKQNSLYKGMRLMNTECIIAAALFTARETKMLLSMKKPRSKDSRLEKRINILMSMLIGLAFVIMFIFAGIGVVKWQMDRNMKSSTMILEPSSAILVYLQRFVQFFVITSQLLPIALFVTLEFTRFVQSMIIDADKQLRREDVQKWIDQNPGKKIKEDPEYQGTTPSQMSVQIKNSIAIENLCEVDIIFSDKTGTMTKNCMKFASWVDQDNNMQTYKQLVQESKLKESISQEFSKKSELFCLALCHTIMPFDGVFQGESPDEVALSNAAREMKLNLTRRDAHDIYLEMVVNNIKCQIHYKIIDILEFNSDRKKMSIILQEVGQDHQQYPELQNIFHIYKKNMFFTPKQLTEPGIAFSITKGADSIMLPLLKVQQTQHISEKIDQLSEQGLRTLVYGSKKLDQINMDKWIEQFQTAKQKGAKSDEYKELSQQIETQMEFRLVSAVEDELQDDIQNTLVAFRKAGINLWMLTGDKTLTAENIARTSGLASMRATMIRLTSEDLENRMKNKQANHQKYTEEQKDPQQSNELYNALNEMLDEAINLQLSSLTDQKEKDQYNKETTQKYQLLNKNIQKQNFKVSVFRKPEKLRTLNFSVLLDCNYLKKLQKYQLEYKFFQLAYNSQSVICCRLEPPQKEQIVLYSHLFNPNSTSLSIGDGMNDVLMIKAAQIGVGVAGKEGMHACNNADVSIIKFSDLRRLIFVHGRLNHMRNSFLTDYSIYKNSINVFINLIFQFYCNFTAQIALEQFLQMMFNTLITFFCVFAFSISDKDILEKKLIEYPQALRDFKQKTESNFYSILYNVAMALVSAIVIFYCFYGYFGNGVLHQAGYQSDLYTFQTVVTMTSCFVAIVRVLLYTNQYNVLIFIGILLALVSMYVTQIIGYYWSAFGIGQVGQLTTIYSSIGIQVVMAVATILALLPQFLVYTAKIYIQPEERDILIERDDTCHIEKLL